MSWRPTQNGRRRQRKTKRLCSTEQQNARAARTRHPISGGLIQDVFDAAKNTLSRGKQTWKDTTEYMQELGDCISESYRQAKGTFRRHLAEVLRDEYAEGDIIEAYDFLEKFGDHISPFLVAEIYNDTWFAHISKYLPILADPKTCLNNSAELGQDAEQRLLLSGQIRELFEFLNNLSVVFAQIDWVKEYAPGFMANAYLDIILRNKHRIILRFLEEQTIPITPKWGTIVGYSLEMTFSEGTVYTAELNLSQSSAQVEFNCNSSHQGISHTQVCLVGEDLRRTRGTGPSVLYGLVKVYLCVKWQGPSDKYNKKYSLERATCT